MGSQHGISLRSLFSVFYFLFSFFLFVDSAWSTYSMIFFQLKEFPVFRFRLSVAVLNRCFRFLVLGFVFTPTRKV